MISYEEVETVLPSPLKIDLCSDMEEYESSLRESLDAVMIKHNKQYDTKIERIKCICNYDIQTDECRFFVGKKTVQIIKSPKSFRDTFFIESQLITLICTAVEQILNIWHDKIIELQNKNEKKIEELKDEEYYEMLYAYYSFIQDGRGFKYLKKLAKRYPNSKYKFRLKRIYQNGLYGWHKKNELLAKKMVKSRDKEESNF